MIVCDGEIPLHQGLQRVQGIRHGQNLERLLMIALGSTVRYHSCDLTEFNAISVTD